ncbi:MAG: type II secretion system F family protein [Deltaproteobacteria bacterium]|nr:type II secretion system F family protein [Deltaproteobacteria bacterium]
MRQNYGRKLITASLKEEFTPDEFIAFKFFLIAFFPIAGAILNSLELIDTSWYYFILFGIGGWFYPDLWIGGRIKRRQREILKSLPFIVDLLVLSTEAGLDFIGAIGKVVEKAAAGPMVDEFAQLLREIRLGSSRADALREMSIRINMIEINSFVAILISADQMGASIGKILRQQSDQIRTERMIRAEKAGAAASQKILIPLVFFILPAVLIMIFGPFFLDFLSGGGGK